MYWNTVTKVSVTSQIYEINWTGPIHCTRSFMSVPLSVFLLVFLYNGNWKTSTYPGCKSPRQQSTQISQQYSQKVSSNSLLPICKLNLLFCFVLPFIQVITCRKKRTYNSLAAPIHANTEKKGTNNNNNKKKFLNYRCNFEGLKAVYWCCLFSLHFWPGKCFKRPGRW